MNSLLRFLKRHRVAGFGLVLGSLALVVAQANSGSGDYTFEPGFTAAANNPDAAVDLNDGRDSQLFLPSGYSPDSPVPLLINLHGYSGTGASHSSYTFMQDAANKAGMAYIAPNGTKDNLENNFWNAGSACCNFNVKQVDDIAYLNLLIEKARSSASIDSTKIYLFGHSNGAFMSYAYLCSGTTKVAAVAGLAGAMELDPKLCNAQPSRVLHIHGQLDETILYEGGALFGNRYTSAEETVNQWSQINGCRMNGETDLDLLDSLTGNDTKQVTYGCKTGELELWRLPQGEHTPVLDLAFAQRVLDWLENSQSELK